MPAPCRACIRSAHCSSLSIGMRTMPLSVPMKSLSEEAASAVTFKEGSPSVSGRVIDEEPAIQGSGQDAAGNNQHGVGIDDGLPRKVRKLRPLSAGIELNDATA